MRFLPFLRFLRLATLLLFSATPLLAWNPPGLPPPPATGPALTQGAYLKPE